jgi:hypothetical protein
VCGIDLQSHGIPRAQIPAYYDRYTYIVGDSVDAVETVKSIYWDRELVIGLVLQDSSHHYSTSKVEFQRYSEMMDGGIWICDDITPAFHDPLVDPPGKGMVQYFEELPGEKYLFPDVLHKGNTMGVVLL